MTLQFLPLPLLLCLCAAAHAQLAATSPDPVPRVEISGPTATSVRRNDSTLRIVVSRSELAAYGDNSLAAVLQRQPGVSVVGGEIRLRGLGAGYTQLLINGAPAPATLALDSIAPELIERIEILRSASAEYSAQGSAGSINLILRKGSRQPRQELKLTVEQLAGRAVPSAALQLSAQHDALGYGLTATLSDSAWRETPHSLERSSTADALRATSERNERQLGRLSLLPRLNWKGSDGATLDWQSLLDLNRDHGHGHAQETLLAGSPSSYPLNAWQSQAHNGVLRSTLNWGQRLDADGQLSVRIGVDHSRRRSDYRFDGATTDGTPRLRRAVTAAADDSSLTSSGKYARSWLQQHRFALGWDGASTRRSESRQQDDTALPGAGASQLVQQYQARVERIAVFAQDEWEAGAGLQTYAGLRWEGLSTRTSGAALAAVSNQSGVWSPVAQLVWQLPGRPREQLRLALARTYKAPPTRDLLPRRYTVNNGNSPTNPDQQGNPALRPELAWGLDGAYEWYPAPQASASLSAYLRRIHDVTLQRLFEQDGHWVSSPANLGGARVAGLEFDTRLPLQALLATAPALELRLNAARNWSQLDAVAGPDNRLAAQLPASANIGLDYRPTAAWTLGLHASLQRGGKLRLSAQRSSDSSTQRTLDLFASWKPSPRSQLRMALLNLFPQARQQGQFYADGMASWSSVSTTPSQRGLRFVLDQSL